MGIFWRGKTAWGRTRWKGQELRKSLKTASETVARRRFKDWVDELDELDRRPRYTYDDMALRFIDEHFPTVRPRSAQRYRTSMDALIDHFEKRYLFEITSAMLSEFVDKRRRAGARIAEQWIGKRSQKPITMSTIRRDLACLSAMFGCAVEWEWVDHNPLPAFMKAASKRGLREGEPSRRWLTPEEEAKLLIAACEDVAERLLHDAICLAIDTGLRKEELFSLRLNEHVNLDRNQIDLSGKKTKGRRSREVPLLPRARRIIEDMPRSLRSDYLLTNPATGTRYAGMDKGLAGAAKRAGIRPLSWHDLRRTCGCRLLQEHNLSMEQVSRWLGHSSVLVTERVYAFLETEHLHAAIDPTRRKSSHSRAQKRAQTDGLQEK